MSARPHHKLFNAYSWNPPTHVASDSGLQDSEAPEQSSFAMLGLSGGQLLWHAGFVAIPVALFFVGTAQYDLLHAPYLLLLLGHLAWSGLGLVPLPHMALLPFRQVTL